MLFVLPDIWQQSLQYNLQAIQNGQFWRWITGHLLHTNDWHLLLNGVGVLLLWSLHGDYYNWQRYFLLLSGLILGCSAGLYFFSPELQIYVGLSGALHGLFVWGAMTDVHKKLHSGWILLLGIAVKIYYEQTDGASQNISELINAQVAVDAHLYGALAGVLMFPVIRDKVTK
jgi:rhomboid family GlyGly-CTERM serine protease